MSLFPLKPRPIPTRDKDPARLRDDRLFIVACDDTFAPKQYFNFLKLNRVRIHVVPTEKCDSVAAAVLERLLQFEHEEYDERWLLLDTDHCIFGTHLASFLRALKDAEDQGVKVALSRPCFEVWLLLHHVEPPEVSPLNNARETENALRKAIGEYNKTNIKPEHYPPDAIAQASDRARALDQIVTGGLIPDSNTTRVYKLLESIAQKALPSELPEPLRALLLGS